MAQEQNLALGRILEETAWKIMVFKVISHKSEVSCPSFSRPTKRREGSLVKKGFPEESCLGDVPLFSHLSGQAMYLNSLHS